MFFPEKIKSIKRTDRVLEVGPGGGKPHQRPDVFLEKQYDTDGEAHLQRSFDDQLQTNKHIVYYDGGRFPFRDQEFDYVICSQVLDHVPNVEYFVSELCRVASKGYIEFGTVYFDLVYNHPTHVTLLFEKDGTIYYMPKEESGLNAFLPIQQFFNTTQLKGYTGLLDELKTYIFQGFEWFGNINIKRASSLEELTYNMHEIRVAHNHHKGPHYSMMFLVKAIIKKIIWYKQR